MTIHRRYRCIVAVSEIIGGEEASMLRFTELLNITLVERMSSVINRVDTIFDEYYKRTEIKIERRKCGKWTIVDF